MNYRIDILCGQHQHAIIVEADAGLIPVGRKEKRWDFEDVPQSVRALRCASGVSIGVHRGEPVEVQDPGSGAMVRLSLQQTLELSSVDHLIHELEADRHPIDAVLLRYE